VAAESSSGPSARPRRPRASPPGTPRPGPVPPRTSSRFVEILRGRDFRLLWGGEFVSLLGSQFFTVALPWLVLQLTGDAFSIGGVTAVGAAPRSVFILLGGALIDRTSPRAVMLYSNIARMGLVAVLAVITVTGVVQEWMLYLFNFLLGLGYALYLPAQSAMIPRLVREDRLQTGNAVIQGTAQLSLFLGPVLGGVLIAFLGEQTSGGKAVPQASGIAIALALNAVTFLVSAVTLSLIRLPSGRGEEGGYDPACELAGRGAGGGAGGAAYEVASVMLCSLREGLATVWRDRTLRLYFVLIGVVNLALLGPIAVAIPVLAQTRFSGGALAYGTILSGLGAGALVGVVAGGALRRPPGRAFAAAMLGSVVVLGIGLALLGAFTSTAGAAAAAFLVGLAEGYLTIEFITWLQLRSSKRQLGRMISILLFASVGMAPVSNLVAGALVGLNAPLVMIGAGGIIVLVAIVSAFSPSVWQLSERGARPGA
jgi:MFS family permease